MHLIKKEMAILWLLCFILIAGYIGFDFITGKITPVKNDQTTVRKPSTAMYISGRYILGITYLTDRINSLIQNQKQHTAPPFNKKDLVQNDSDALCYGIIYGELYGRQAALAYFQKLILPKHNHSLTSTLELLKKIYTSTNNTNNKEQAHVLKKHLGWFAEIATTSHLAHSDPYKKAAQTPAIRMVLVASIASFAGILLLLVSIALFFKTLHSLIKKTFVYKYQELCVPPEILEINDHNDRAVYFKAFLFFMTGLFILSLLGIYMTRIVIISGYIILPIIIYILFFRPKGWRRLRHAIGLLKGAGIVKEIISGLAGYLAGLPVLFLGLVISSLISAYTKIQPIHPIAAHIQNASMVYLIIIFLFASIIAPVMEEIIFRGLFYHYLRGKFSIVLSALISGLIFAAVHPQGIVAVPVLTAIAFNLALIREWRGSLIASITAHSFNNSIAVGLLIVFLM